MMRPTLSPAAKSIRCMWRRLRVMRYAGSVIIDYKILRNWIKSQVKSKGIPI